MSRFFYMSFLFVCLTFFITCQKAKNETIVDGIKIKFSNIEPISKEATTFYNQLKNSKSPFDKNTPLKELREINENMTKGVKMPPDVKVEKISIGTLNAEWLRPTGTDGKGAVLYLHGGGGTMGSCNTHRGLAADIASASGTSVLLLDYRLAPENPFPAGMDDALAAYDWLLKSGFSSKNIVIAGDSTGGGLAIAVAMNLRDKKAQMPAAIACISPLLDSTLSMGESIKSRKNIDPMIKKDFSVYMEQLYAGSNDLKNPLISPIYGDLRELPPVFIQIGNFEVFLSSAVLFADKAKKEGLDVNLEVWDGMWHEWQMYAGYMPEAQSAINSIGSFIKKKINS